MKKLLILSGKGGTGKTTTAASFIRFGNAKAMADCDVDAPNLHIVTSMKTEPQEIDFMGSDKAFIDSEKCIGCGKCIEHCRFNAIKLENGRCRIEEHACEGCGVCNYVCPVNAAGMQKDVAGTRYVYNENGNVFSTAKLKMGRGNSGKLVTEVKYDMIKNAVNGDIAIVDGSPGIGCPVIASVSGMDMVLIVAEPSLSGLSDLERLVHTASILQVKVAVCINKCDNSPEKTAEIEEFCKRENVAFVGKIPYDKKASEAINTGKSLATFDIIELLSTEVGTETCFSNHIIAISHSQLSSQHRVTTVSNISKGPP